MIFQFIVQLNQNLQFLISKKNIRIIALYSMISLSGHDETILQNSSTN